MSQVLDTVLAANQAYAANFGDKGSLPLPPGRHFAILTCMDARLDPAKYAGLAEGDAHVIRPLVPPTIPIYGFIYDVKTGQLIEVQKATEVGRTKTTVTA